MSRSTVPSKLELLEWLNAQIADQMSPLSRIESLGNGVAYLYLWEKFHPGSIKANKIIIKPINDYECTQNLKYLAAAVANAPSMKPVEVNKLAQMKFQDNLAFLQELYKHAQTAQTKPDNKPKPPERQTTFKPRMIIPEKLIITETFAPKRIDEQADIFKIRAPETNKDDRLELIKHVFEQKETTDQMKLLKIKRILLGQQSLLSAQKKNTRVSELEKSTPMAERYRKFTFDESYFKNKSIPKVTDNFKAKNDDKEDNGLSNLDNKPLMSPSRQSTGRLSIANSELLLSQDKQQKIQEIGDQ